MAISRGTTTKKLVSATAFLDTRDINPDVIDVALETGYDDLMQMSGNYRKTEQPNYHHFVNEDLFQVLTFDTGGVSGSGTATLTVTITTTGFVRRDNKLKFPNGKVGKISSAITTGSNKDSFTITSVDGSNLTAADGDTVTVMGLTVGEGSKEVTALHYGQTKYFNLIETFRDKTSITDVQKASKIETSNGYIVYKQAIEQAQSFKTGISATLIGGVKSVNEYGTASPTLVDENSNSVQTTGGIDQEIATYGVDDSVATLGTVTMSDIDGLCDELIAVKAPSDYLNLGPDAALRRYSTFFKNLGSAGLEPARLQMNGKEVDFNVQKFMYGRFSFEFAGLKILDHPHLFSHNTISKTIYGLPKDKVKVQGSGANQSRIGVRYIPNPAMGRNQGTDIIHEWYTGALAPSATNGDRVLDAHFVSQQGNECLGTRQMFRQRILS